MTRSFPVPVIALGLLLAGCGGVATPARSAAAKPSAAAPSSAAAAASAAPASAKPAASASAAPATVRVAFSGAGTDSSLFIGLDKGFFAEQGITIQDTRLNSSDMPPQLAAGALDVGAGSFNVSLVNAAQRGLDLKLVADKARCLPGTGPVSTVVRKDLYDSGKVTGPKDFKGLTFGIQSVGSGSEVELDSFLRQGGLTIADVTRKSMTYPDMRAAFSNKGLDATSAPEPVPAQLETDKLAVRVGKCGDYNPNGEISQILYGPKFIADQPDVAKRFMVAYLKSVRYFNDAFVKGDPKVQEDVLGIMSKGTKTDVQVYKNMYDGKSMWGIDPDGQINVDNLQKDLDFWLNVTGELKQTIDLGKLVDMSFAKAAVQVLGPYK
jgi:NitT/TauT family transport system substrate-binding protein